MANNSPHGFQCNARTFPIRCKYCHQDVFYFSCDHGSKVFFDELGAPWKVHACMERVISILGQDRVEQEIANRMMTPYMSVDYERYVKHGKQERQNDPQWEEKHLTRLEPYHKLQTQEDGIIRELSLDINIFKKFKIEDTPLWRRSLKHLIDNAEVQVTIHTGAIGDEDPYSITFFVKRQLIKQKALTIGDFVECHLKGFEIPGKDNVVWICEKLRSAFD